MARSLAAVVDQMRQAGMPAIDAVELEVNSGRIKRYPEKGPGKGRAWYRIHEMRGRDGRPLYFGAFGEWGRIEAQKIAHDAREVDVEDLAAMRERVRENAEREAKRRVRDAERAAARARATWQAASVRGSSPYLVRKQVADPALGGWIRFQDDGTIVVPMVRYDYPPERRLRGVQTITPDGVKRFSWNMEKDGAAAVLGLHAARSPILIAEGLATAASCWLALERRYRVVIAFDAGSLLPVARIVRTLHPDARLLFCADDDARSAADPGFATGRVKAREAALELGRAGVVWPYLTATAHRIDFNDLHVARGLGAVADQLRSALQWLPKL